MLKERQSRLFVFLAYPTTFSGSWVASPVDSDVGASTGDSSVVVSSVSAGEVGGGSVTSSVVGASVRGGSVSDSGSGSRAGAFSRLNSFDMYRWNLVLAYHSLDHPASSCITSHDKRRFIYRRIVVILTNVSNIYLHTEFCASTGTTKIWYGCIFQQLKIATKTSFLHFSDVGMLKFSQVHYISFSAWIRRKFLQIIEIFTYFPNVYGTHQMIPISLLFWSYSNVLCLNYTIFTLRRLFIFLSYRHPHTISGWYTGRQVVVFRAVLHSLANVGSVEHILHLKLDSL